MIRAIIRAAIATGVFGPFPARTAALAMAANPSHCVLYDGFYYIIDGIPYRFGEPI